MAFNNQSDLSALAQQLSSQQTAMPKTEPQKNDLENLAVKIAQEHEMLAQPKAISEPKSLLGTIGTAATAIPVAATQELRRMTKNLPGSKYGLINLVNLALQKEPQEIQHTPELSPLAGQIGTTLGHAVGLGGQAIASAPLLELTAASRLPSALKPLLSGGLTGAATSPQSPLIGAMTGAAGGAALESIHPIVNLAKNVPNLFVEGLGNKITNTFEDAKNIGKNLYSKAFQGAEKIIPTVSQDTGILVQKLKNLFEEPQKIRGIRVESAIDNALNTYQRNVPKKGIESLHDLRSDLSKIYVNGADKALKSGLDATGKLKQDALLQTINSISKDTANNLKNLSPDNLANYEKAQLHWRNNVVPFRNLLSIRKLLGTEKEPTSSLFRDLARRAESAKKVRDVLGMSRTTAQIGNLIHNKLGGLPRGILSDAGLLGAGAVLGHNIL